MLEFLWDPLVALVEQFGMLAVFVTMLLESAGVPIPSEIVVPFAGFMASLGHLSFWQVVLVSSLANLVGSIIAYFLGSKFRPYVPKILEHHLEMSDKFFGKYGTKAVFVGRLLPAIRTFISFPAGASGVPLTSFVVLTFVGALPWNFALAAAGYFLGHNWELIHNNLMPISIGLVLIIAAIILAGFNKRFYKSGKEK
ncbi:MAG: DedA family protein [Candidatus Altiarchaeota archaeon]|nr:DedA family protein [Candidatus Altiarchaeota archaeon]